MLSVFYSEDYFISSSQYAYKVEGIIISFFVDEQRGWASSSVYF